MKKEQNLDKEIRRMLRRDSYQRILDYLAKTSGYKEATLNKSGVISSVVQEVFPYTKDGIARTISAILIFSMPIYNIVEANGNSIKVTEKTLRYASKQ